MTKSVCLLAATLSLAAQSFAVTAFQAVEIARKQVNPYAAKSLVQIVGKSSAVSATPVEWQILFYDPSADQSGTMVTVGGNVVTSIRDGYTQTDKVRVFAYKMEEIIDPAKLKIDSSRIIPLLQAEANLKGVKISSVGLWLRKEKKSPLAAPVWLVDLFGTNAKANKEVKFGTAKLDAETGKIIRLDVDLKEIDRE